ncbi:hypothetical protein MMC20_001730 [Loxospora ochrophaea]|nr:hypothetical protein [Loxospora ochrophaea]
MINAALGEAKKGVFRHFVYSSVLCTQLRKLANHDCKRYVEECLMESELNYTILKPSIFMDGMAVEKLISDPSPVHPAFYDPNVCFAWTSLYDLGEAAAKVVEEMEKHYLAVYDTVSSSPPMGHTEAVEIIGKTLGKKIEVRRLPFSEAFGTFEKRFGQDPHKYTKHSAARMLLHYEYYGLRGSPNVLEWLLGRKPESFEVFTERKMREAQK